MLRTTLGWIGIALVGASYLPAAKQQSSSTAPPASSPQRAVLNRYCVTCHNEKLRTAGLMLDRMEVERISAGAEVWEKVVRKLRTGAMPPAGAPRPDRATYDSLATYLETGLDRAVAAHPNPGRIAVHRLHRTGYANAIRDLLAMDTDAIDIPSLLPADDSSYGFDNIGGVLSVSPLLLERYMSAARKVSRLAIGSPLLRPDFQMYEVSSLFTQDERMSEALPFGSRGGIAVRHYFPLDGEYLIKVHVQGSGSSYNLDVRLDGARVKLFTGGDKPEGDSEEYAAGADPGLEVRIPVKAGARLVGATFLNKISDREGVLRPGVGGGNATVDSLTISGPYEAKGPGDTPSRRKIFVCHPAGSAGEEPCAKKILSTLARRAYRRPVTEEDVQPLLSLYRAGRSQRGFEAGIERALRAMLVSPDFLFRIERDPVPPGGMSPDTAYRISDLELASRLSFFLWSSIPDDELLELAERGQLKDPAVLEQQVRRMLGDSRSKALVGNFAGQWLLLRNMRLVLPDSLEFPDFDGNLREAFERETELLLDSMLREDRPVLDLLNADYTFLNERLARHYGISNIFGSHFRRVTLADENRRGLLGKASILMVTSSATRTSPVLRGKWLLENILGAPPPPPPPNVPPLKARNDDGKVLSMRQQMEQHRANPACAVCHKQMDPLGFALENFDAIGRWRTTSGANHSPIDASGVLPDGTRFDGPAELRKILLSRREEFVTTVTEKLLTYALGRGVEYYDAPSVRKIVREAAPGEYRWSSLILGIVESTPFQMRRAGQLPTTVAGRR